MKTAWHLFVVSLSGRQASSRMRLWRALRTSGAALIRDGVYLVAENPRTMTILADCAQQIERAGGRADFFAIELTAAQRREWQPLFDRSDAYLALQKSIQALQRQFKRGTEGRMRQKLAQLQTEFEHTVAIDTFPTSQQDKVRKSLAACAKEIENHFLKGEPHSRSGIIPIRAIRDYQGRSWATRRDLWVDRVASAWLIQRFIDKCPRFIWLKDLAKCPKSALGFDFDNATFSHIGTKVTFEVLVTSFQLQDDEALNQIAAMVHYLDVGGVAVAEADGFVAILTGARARCTNDTQLIKAMFPVLDDLYTAYLSRENASTNRKSS